MEEARQRKLSKECRQVKRRKGAVVNQLLLCNGTEQFALNSKDLVVVMSHLRSLITRKRLHIPKSVLLNLQEDIVYLVSFSHHPFLFC